MNEIKCEDRLEPEQILEFVQSMKLDLKQQEIAVNRMGPDELGNFFREKYSFLNDRYPGILNMFVNDAIEGIEFDDQRLISMLNLLKMMKSEKKTEVETNVELMTNLRNKYVLPKLGEIPENIKELDPEKYKDVDWNNTNINFSM